MIEATARSASVSKPRARRRSVPSNVVRLHQRIMPRHTALLARWLEAGRRMGLCDASAFTPERTDPGKIPSDYILVWVRENMDPAYMIKPEALGWAVIDAIRQQTLGQTRSFEAALHMIRPVLPLEAAA